MGYGMKWKLWKVLGNAVIAEIKILIPGKRISRIEILLPIIGY